MKQIVVILALTGAVLATKDPRKKLLESNQAFTSNVYKQVSKLKPENENLLICPLSAQIILSLAQTGARGKTRKEMRSALHLSNNTEEIKIGFKKLLTELKNIKEINVQTANKVFIKTGFTIKESFSVVAKKNYQSGIENVDFTKKEEATKTINDWVSNKTNNKIQNLVEPEILSEDTVAVLVNAIYLQAEWRKHFKKTLTKKGTFYKSETEEIETDMMKTNHFFGFYESDDLDAKFLQIPFKNRNASFVIVLPNQRNGLQELEKEVSKVFQLNFQNTYMEVVLPKFKIENSIDFKSVLKKLGMKKAFTRADFSEMAGEKGEIHISDVVQKSFLSVNEQGLEAAAATAVVYNPKSLMDAAEQKNFIVDHPFLFYVEINSVAVFIGRIVDPSAL